MERINIVVTEEKIKIKKAIIFIERIHKRLKLIFLSKFYYIIEKYNRVMAKNIEL